MKGGPETGGGGRVIDAHVHLYWPEVNADPSGWAARHGEAHWAAMATRRRRSGRPVQGFPSVGELLQAMDAAGVERAVLLGWYWERAAACEEQNRFYAQCLREHPDRLSAAVTLCPAAGREHVAGEIDRGAAAGFQGIGELSPHAQHYAIDDPAFAFALSRAAELGWPVNLHVTDPAARPYPGQVATPLEDFTRLAAGFPRTVFILAHWGGRASAAPEGMAAPAAEPLPGNLYFDTAASPLSHDAAVWRRFVGRWGADRVLFGSDFPLDLYPAGTDRPSAGLSRMVAEARAAGLSSRQQDALLADNAGRWFGPRRPA